MKLNRLIVLSSAFSAGFLIAPCFAEEVTQPITDGAATEAPPAAEEPIADQSTASSDKVVKEVKEAWRFATGELEVGVGHVSDDSYKFGRYTGLNDEGPYPIADIKMGFGHGRADYMQVIGTDLGLDSRNIQIEYGKQGKFDGYFEYDQLPNLMIDSAVTPFSDAGSDNLTLLPGFDINNLNSYQDLTTETERRRLDAGFSFVPEKHWKIGISGSHETKKGTDIIGGPIGNSSANATVGNTVSALLPEPIDYVTKKLELAMDYAKDGKQMKLGYQMSLFENQEESLTWENPFGGTTPPTGRLALPPSNQFHQVSLSGAYAVNPETRLTGLISTGLMLQDEQFLPYSTSVPDTPPVDSLNGEVQVTSARVSVTHRASQKLRYKASYAYDEHNNTTPQETFSYFALDSDRTTGSSAGDKENTPLSYEKHKLNLSGRYRSSQGLLTSFGYENKSTKRLFSDVEQNDENKVFATFKANPRSDLDIAVKLSTMKRRSSDYQAESSNQNKLVRKYYLADVKQDMAGISFYYIPNSSVSIGLNADLAFEDYTDSELGITDSDRTTYSLDLTYIPRKDISIYAFYSLEGYDTSQKGAQSASNNWYADVEDRIDTFGTGIKISGIRGMVDVGADLVYTLAESDTRTMSSDPTVTTVPYPTLSNELTSFKIYALYKPREKLAMKLSYLYEVYESDDWALDGVDANAVEPNMILLGNESADYDNSVVMASMLYKF